MFESKRINLWVNAIRGRKNLSSLTKHTHTLINLMELDPLILRRHLTSFLDECSRLLSMLSMLNTLPSFYWCLMFDVGGCQCIHSDSCASFKLIVTGTIYYKYSVFCDQPRWREMKHEYRMSLRVLVEQDVHSQVMATMPVYDTLLPNRVTQHEVSKTKPVWTVCFS